MFKLFLKRFKNKKYGHEIAPEDIFLDSSNLPEFDKNQMEGRMAKSISRRHIAILGIFFVFVGIFLIGRAFVLQIMEGQKYALQSQNNSLSNDVMFADRGLITGRNGTLLAWNIPNPNGDNFSLRKYINQDGYGNLLGYVKYPAKDSSGFYYKKDYTGIGGIESYFNSMLQGTNGLKIVEKNVRGQTQSESTIRPAQDGKTLTLSVDATVQKDFYESVKAAVDKSGFVGGGGVIMDAHTGEVLAMVTYPEFDPEVMTEGSDVPAIQGYLTNKGNPFLDRAISGLYAPGSIIKPFLGIGALTEGVITPDTKILSTGSITIPNPYNPKLPALFRDWRVNGWTNIEQAIAVSSDVFFYEVGGGYGNQKGIGISGIDKYASMFGFGSPITNSYFSTANNGVIPSPAWKAQNFNGDPWRLGDTYHTSIGQFGFLVTPMQVARALSGLVTNGVMTDPTILKQGTDGYVPTTKTDIQGISPANYQVIKDGMRLAVTDGIMGVLKFPDISISGKTGTAEVGVNKDYVNSWVTGFFPSDNPKYVFALVLEKGPVVYSENATGAMRNLFQQMDAGTTTAGYLR